MSKHTSIACRQQGNFVGTKGKKKKFEETNREFKERKRCRKEKWQKRGKKEKKE